MFTNFLVKSQSRKVAKLFFLSSFFFLLSSQEVEAQCAMCRAVLETEEGGAKAEAINDGIVYLMAIPYILIGIVGYAIYKVRTKKR